MSTRQPPALFRPAVLLAALLTASFMGDRGTSAAFADGLLLRDGGEIRGQITSRPGSEVMTIRTLSGLTISVDRGDVVSIYRRTAKAEEYITRARSVPDTVEDREALARWCVKNRLLRQRLDQYRAILALDPQHKAANRALGNVLREGVWMTRAEARTADGLVNVDGKWVTPQEAEFLAQQGQLDDARKAWFKVVADIERRMASEDLKVARAALLEIAAIDDAAAIDALMIRLGDDPRVPVRAAVIDALSRFVVLDAVRPLVAFAVEDADAGIRQKAAQAVPIELRLTAADLLVDRLKHDDNMIVVRAAEALEVVGTLRTAPRLIAALVTTHKRTVRVLDTSPRYTVGNGQIGARRGSAAVLPPQVVNGLQNGAYPFGVNIIPPDDAYVTKTVRVGVRNPAVLKTLVKLTGEDFGFNEAAWVQWWKVEGRFKNA